MVRACSVLGCKSGGIVPSHRFPSDEKRLLLWKKCIKFFKEEGLSSAHLKTRVVCYKHFKDSDYASQDYKKRRLKPEALPSLNLPYETDGPECISANNESDISPDNEIHILMGDNSSETHHASQETSTLHVTANDDSPASRDVNNCGNELTVLSLLPTSKCFNSHISLRKVKCKNSVLSYQQLTRAVCTHRRYLQGVSKQMLLFRRRLIEEGFRRGKTIEALQQKLSSTEKRFIEMQIRASIHKLKVIKKLYYDIAKCLA